MDLSQNKKSEADFFDQFRDEGYDVFTESGYDRILQEFKRLVNPQPGEVVFDLGCGTGAFSERLFRQGLRVRGIDISEGCIEFAKRQNPKIDFQVADVENLNSPDASVDIVVFSGTIHHFFNLRPSLKEAYRVLGPKGRIFSYDPNVANPAMWLYRDKRSPLYSSKGVTENEHPLSREEITTALQSCGFSDIQSFGISGVGFKYVESKTAQAVLPLYNLFDAILDKTFLARKIGAFLISYARKI